VLLLFFSFLFLPSLILSILVCFFYVWDFVFADGVVDPAEAVAVVEIFVRGSALFERSQRRKVLPRLLQVDFFFSLFFVNLNIEILVSRCYLCVLFIWFLAALAFSSCVVQGDCSGSLSSSFRPVSLPQPMDFSSDYGPSFISGFHFSACSLWRHRSGHLFFSVSLAICSSCASWLE
jgi:hypothetical protein